MTKFTSFTRRLKRWKFSRVPSGREIGAYFHQHFQRGKPELAKTLIYPMNADNPPPFTGGNEGPGKPDVSKACAALTERRSSSIIPSKVLPSSVSSNTGHLDNASPTPIRALKRTKDDGIMLPLQILESEMITWLSNVDFVEDEGSLIHDYASLVSGGSQPGASLGKTTDYASTRIDA